LLSIHGFGLPSGANAEHLVCIEPCSQAFLDCGDAEKIAANVKSNATPFKTGDAVNGKFWTVKTESGSPWRSD
jgi:hypothetical protein